jgi:tRNA-dihydrouridine synthase
MSHTLLSSPLQGFTDFRFRNALNKHFGGIDTFYSPYIRLNGKLDVKAAYERDILPENNQDLEVIPQVMTSSAEEFIFVANYVKQFGYKELNWNLGCPYPMVTKRGMGSGLICETEKIDDILKQVHDETDIIVSMKMRMGYEEPTEIIDTLAILDNYPIKNISIHARIGKQLYKGGVDLDSFQNCIDNTKHKVYYNGDITTVAKYNEMVERFPSIDHWMIGRGLISDPFLPQMIKGNSTEYPTDRLDTFRAFHDELFESYESFLSGEKHLLIKMQHFWEYFSTTFDNPQKTYKGFKKAKSVRSYHQAVADAFRLERGL